MRTLLAVLALGVSALLPASAPEGSIDDFIDSEMPASGVPGLAYAVVADGGITTAGARGVVRLGGEVLVTPDTPFVIGSISKSFTALSVMQLVEAGKIDLDTEVSRYLDVFSGRPAGASPSGSSSATRAASPRGRATPRIRTRPARRMSSRAGWNNSRRSRRQARLARSGSTRMRTTRSLVAWSRS